MSKIDVITLAIAKHYTDEHSGGSFFCGDIDENTQHLPTTRPDESPLQDGDFLKVKRTANVPFTVDEITFETTKDVAVYIGTKWLLNASAFQDTAETPTANKATESLSGEAVFQSQVNAENARFINNLKAIIEVTSLPSTDIKEESAYHLTTSTATYPAGYYYYNGTEWVCIYGLSVDDINLTKIEDYLYSVNYGKADYVKALNYFETRYHNSTWDGSPYVGACTAVRKGNTFGRNYDWNYNECVSFVVRREGGNGWYSYLGTTGGLKEFKKDDVASRKWIDDYDILPFFILDGVNEHGVSVSVNVVPTGDKGITTGTHSVLSGDNICMLMLPAYVLGKFDTAQSAVNWIVNTAKIYAPKNATIQQELHFMIADKNKTYVVEFINNVAIATEQDYMTNFYFDGVSFDTDGKVINSTVTQYGQGLERYNYIVENSAQPISELMENLFYTNAYKDVTPRWDTEFTGNWAEQGLPYPNLTVTSPSSDFDGIIAAAKTKYENRNRDESSPNYGTWQTVNSCIYDIEKKTLKLRVQEQTDKVSMFSLFDISQDTKDVDVSNSATESYTGTANTQADINIENKETFGTRVAVDHTQIFDDTQKNTARDNINAQKAFTVGDGLEISNDILSAKVMTGATTIADGAVGVVPAPTITDRNKFLLGDGTWGIPQLTRIYIPDNNVVELESLLRANNAKSGDILFFSDFYDSDSVVPEFGGKHLYCVIETVELNDGKFSITASVIKGLMVNSYDTENSTTYSAGVVELNINHVDTDVDNFYRLTLSGYKLDGTFQTINVTNTDPQKLMLGTGAYFISMPITQARYNFTNTAKKNSLRKGSV